MTRLFDGDTFRVDAAGVDGLVHIRSCGEGTVGEGHVAVRKMRQVPETQTVRTLAAVAVALLSVAVGSCRPGQGQRPLPDKVRMAIPKQPPCTLVFVAQEQGLFAREGLDIVPVYRSSGKEALAALTRGEADFASTAETPASIEAFTDDGFRVLAAIASTDNDPCIVARRDAGIAGPADLRGKKVGTQKASAVHFFLHLFLTRHLIPDDQVTCEFGTGEDMVERLVSGDVDAVSVREPQVTHATAALGAKAVVFREPGIYRRWEVLAGSVKVLSERPKTAVAMLKALRAAQKLTQSRRAVAGEALARALGIDVDTALASVRETDLRVRLSQDLLISMEEEARWAAQKKMVGGANVPDFLRILYPDPLAAVDPDSVTLTYRPRSSP